MQEMSVSVQMQVVCCEKCSVPFGVPVGFVHRQTEGVPFYCPSGHPNGKEVEVEIVPQAHKLIPDRPTTVPEKVMAFMRTQNGGIYYKDVQKRVDANPGSVSGALASLVKSGKLERVNMGVYRLAQGS